MASSQSIVQNLQKLKQVKTVECFEPASSEITSRSNPVQMLKTRGVSAYLMRINSTTVDKILDHCIQLVKSRKYTTRVHDLHANKLRFDIEFPPDGFCWNLLQRILAKWKKNSNSPWNVFKQQGIEPKLVEFSLLGSLPGAVAQTWHVDHYEGRGKLISFGIPLIDVQDVNGPLNCIPFGLNDEYYKKHPFKVRVRKGEMFAWDGAMRHRGGYNRGSVARPLFMFSLCFSEKIPNGNDQSLHPELMQRLGMKQRHSR